MLVNNESQINRKISASAAQPASSGVVAESAKTKMAAPKRQSPEPKRSNETVKETNQSSISAIVEERLKGKADAKADTASFNMNSHTKTDEKSVNEQREQKEQEEQQLQEATRLLEDVLQMSYTNVEIKMHEGSGRYQIRKVDQETGEVVLEIPPEKMLKIAAMIKIKLDEALGLLVDETA